MKVTIIKKKNEKNSNLISAILQLILGIILVFNADSIITILFTILGVIVIVMGIAKFIQYFNIKSQLKVENPQILYSAIMYTAAGLLVVFLSNFIDNAIRIVTGIWLFFIGLNKLGNAIAWKAKNHKHFLKELTISIIFIILGLYSIFAENAVLIFIGVLLILYSLIQLVNYFLNKN